MPGTAFPHYTPRDTAPSRSHAWGVGYARSMVTTAIRQLESGRADWALDTLRIAEAELDALIAPELRILEPTTAREGRE